MMVRRGGWDAGPPSLHRVRWRRSLLCPPQGDVVNYDEIKRFIQQELNKMFDGKGVAGAGRTPASLHPCRC